MKAGVSTGSPKWSPDSKRVVFYEVPTAHTFAARIYAQGMVTSQIVSVDVATGARVERDLGPRLEGRAAVPECGSDRISGQGRTECRTGLHLRRVGNEGNDAQSGLVARRQTSGLPEGGFHGAAAESAPL